MFVLLILGLATNGWADGDYERMWWGYVKCDGVAVENAYVWTDPEGGDDSTNSAGFYNLGTCAGMVPYEHYDYIWARKVIPGKGLQEGFYYVNAIFYPDSQKGPMNIDLVDPIEK